MHQAVDRAACKLAQNPRPVCKSMQSMPRECATMQNCSRHGPGQIVRLVHACSTWDEAFAVGQVECVSFTASIQPTMAHLSILPHINNDGACTHAV